MHALVLVAGDVTAEMAPYDEGLPNNPDAEWDAYRVGERFDGHLQLLDGRSANSAAKGEIDWTKTSRPNVLVAGSWRVIHRDDNWGGILKTIPETETLTVIDAHV